MLGKLIKHEWKATWKFPALISLFVVILTLLGIWSFKMPFWDKLFGLNTSSFTFFDLAAVGILLMYFLYIVIAVYAIMIYFAIRFYKNMYTDEGYLTHTLPVKPSAHIISKTLVSGTWYLAATVLMLGSLIWLFCAFFSTIMQNAGISATEMAEIGLSISFAQVNQAFNQISSIPFGAFAIIMVVACIISCYSSLLIIYVCISIGQLFKKHKVMASLLTYLVVTTVMEIVLFIAMLPIMFNMLMKGDYFALMESPDILTGMLAPYAMISPIFIVSLIATIIFSIVSFLVTEYIARRKLNLD